MSYLTLLQAEIPVTEAVTEATEHQLSIFELVFDVHSLWIMIPLIIMMCLAI